MTDPAKPSFDKAKAEQEISWLGARLREPTTYAGLGILLTAVFHFGNGQTLAAALTSIGIGVGGIIAILLPEAAAKMVLTGFLVGAGLLYGLSDAHAQVRKPQITGNIIADTKANLGITKPGDAPALTGDPVADLHNAIKKGGAKLLMHLKQQYALAISPGSDGSTQVDPIAAPCAKALVPIVDLVVNGPKATTVAPPDAMALTSDEQTAAADASELDGVLVQVEKIRILRIAVQGNALTIACGPLVQDEVKQAKNLMGGITSLITGAGLLAPIGL